MRYFKNKFYSFQSNAMFLTNFTFSDLFFIINTLYLYTLNVILNQIIQEREKKVK